VVQSHVFVTVTCYILFLHICKKVRFYGDSPGMTSLVSKIWLGVCEIWHDIKMIVRNGKFGICYTRLKILCIFIL